jgi:uncharacterized protein YndB with AHSA1/START domain
MSRLDRKMCIHYGEYLIQKLGDQEELLGAEVIVAHRILKSHVMETTGWVKAEMEIPFPAALIWEYFARPDLEAGFLGYDDAERIDTLGGRVGEGAGFRCAHGDLNIYSKIPAWKPFEYYTMDQSTGLTYVSTCRLIPPENGTRVRIYLTTPIESASDEVRQMRQSAMDAGYAGLQSYIERDFASGKVSTS